MPALSGRVGAGALLYVGLAGVAVVGHGGVSLGRNPADFVYSEVFTFTGGLVSRLDTFHIWLGDRPE